MKKKSETKQIVIDCTITVSINVCMVHFHLKTFNFNPNQQFMDLITQLTSNSYFFEIICYHACYYRSIYIQVDRYSCMKSLTKPWQRSMRSLVKYLQFFVDVWGLLHRLRLIIRAFTWQVWALPVTKGTGVCCRTTFLRHSKIYSTKTKTKCVSITFFNHYNLSQSLS